MAAIGVGPMRGRTDVAALLALALLCGCTNQRSPTVGDPASDQADCRFPEPMTKLLKTQPARAVAACRHLAERGDAAGEARLGFLYQAGLGVQQDFAAAAQWYRLAARQGNAAAQNNLGSLYETGQGVPRDLVQALAWFNLSAAQGNDGGIANRAFVAKQLTPEQVAEAEKLSQTLKQGSGP